MIHGGARFRPRRRTGENVYIIEETGAGRSCPAPVSLDFAAEKAVAGAEPEKRAVREEGQAGFRVALRAELFHGRRIAGVEREEGEKVAAAHLVRRGNVLAQKANQGSRSNLIHCGASRSVLQESRGGVSMNEPQSPRMDGMF